MDCRQKRGSMGVVPGAPLVNRHNINSSYTSLLYSLSTILQSTLWLSAIPYSPHSSLYSTRLSESGNTLVTKHVLPPSFLSRPSRLLPSFLFSLSLSLSTVYCLLSTAIIYCLLSNLRLRSTFSIYVYSLLPPVDYSLHYLYYLPVLPSYGSCR